MTLTPTRIFAKWWAPMAVFVLVLGAQLWLVAAAGTDIPFHDQWGAEGRWLYPSMQEGSLRFMDLFRPHNEHRIIWTFLADIGMFSANGNQWDPLVQLVFGAFLHAACAAVLAFSFGRGLGPVTRWIMIGGIIVASLPVAGWHNALWGFQSQVYFVLLFVLLAFLFLAETRKTRGGVAAGWVMAVFALLAMGPGALALVVLFGMAVLQMVESRSTAGSVWRKFWPVVPLLILAVLLQVKVPAQAVLHAGTSWQLITTAARVLAWPHVDQPWAALVLNIPIIFVGFGRIMRRRPLIEGENFVLMVGGWGVALALATAWSRGGGDELAVSVPSRYADLVVLLPLVNLWCVIALVRMSEGTKALRNRMVALSWGAFLLIGWLGLSAQMMRGVILPRRHDLFAPVRLAVAFQASGDPAVFDGQPRLLVPHPNPATVQTVLTDPRLKGALPPSLQAERPMGPLSRATRQLLGR